MEAVPTEEIPVTETRMDTIEDLIRERVYTGLPQQV